MKPVVAHRGEYRGRGYELALNFDDAALADGAVAVSATVTAWSLDRPDDKHQISAELSIARDDRDRPILTVRLKGDVQGVQMDEVIFERPLSELIQAEQILDSIPAWAYTGDPITGCMVRSGLSALVGQLLDCKKSTEELPWYWPRMRALGHCMLQHVPDMTKTAALRAGKCILRFGV